MKHKGIKRLAGNYPMKILLLYFSGTGNTWWLCEKFKELAEARGATVSLLSIEDLYPNCMQSVLGPWEDSDVIGLAHPIHSSDAPPLIYRFLDKIHEILALDAPPLKKAFVLTTMQSFSGDGALMLRHKLKELGLELEISQDFRMTPNTGVPFLTFNPLPESKFEAQMNHVIVELEKTVTAILKRKVSIKVQYGSFGRFNGWLQRVGPKWKNRTWRYFANHPDRCTHCLICVEQCPVAAIKQEGDKISWTQECTDCFRCYNFCPQRAVTVKGFEMRGRHRQHTYFRDRGFPPV